MRGRLLSTSVFPMILKHFCQVKEKAFALFPAKAWVSNGLAVNSLIYFLTAIFDIALNHETFDNLSDVWIQPAGVYYILSNANLLVELLSGVCMVGIYYYSWICQATFAIHIVNLTQNLIMIIWQAVAC